jgi:hypothetical protein
MFVISDRGKGFFVVNSIHIGIKNMWDISQWKGVFFVNSIQIETGNVCDIRQVKGVLFCQ